MYALHRENCFPAAVILPGQISGPGWTIMNPWANKTASVFQKIVDGREPDIGFLPWDEWCAYTGDPAETDDTQHHIARRGYFDLEMEKRLLGFEPKCTAPETIGIAVQSYIGRGLIRV